MTYGYICPGCHRMILHPGLCVECMLDVERAERAEKLKEAEK